MRADVREGVRVAAAFRDELGLVDRCLRALALPGHPSAARQLDERPDERDVVAELAAQRDRFSRCASAVNEPVRDVQLGGVLLQQRRAFGHRQAIGVPQHRHVVRERLPVGSGLRGLARRGRACRKDRRQVACLGGVVDEQREVSPVAVAEHRHRRSIELDPSDQRKAPLDSASRQLVPERDRAVDHRHDAAPLRFGERLEAAEEHRGELEVCGRRNDGELLERPLFGGIELLQSGQHGVHDRGGHFRSGRCEHLGDEERVPAGARQ